MEWLKYKERDSFPHGGLFQQSVSRLQACQEGLIYLDGCTACGLSSSDGCRVPNKQANQITNAPNTYTKRELGLLQAKTVKIQTDERPR